MPRLTVRGDDAEGLWLLRALVASVESIDDDDFQGIPVTVLQSGLIVSGDLVPTWLGLNAQATEIEFDSIRSVISEHAAQLRQDRLTTEPTVFYLLNAHLGTGPGSTSRNVWVGRIADVTGFAVGRASAGRVL